jgi:hypothetical protein
MTKPIKQNKYQVISEFDNDIWINQKITGKPIRKFPKENALQDAKKGKPSHYCDICGVKYGQSFIRIEIHCISELTICLDCRDKLK